MGQLRNKTLCEADPKLFASDQPDVRSLRCAWNQMAPGNQGLMRHLTLDEMRGALGGWVSLIPPVERL